MYASSEAKNIDERLKTHNLPPVLENVVTKWAREKKEFYLGPENMFFFGGVQLRYQNGENIPTGVGSWSACTAGCLRPKRLSRREIDELQYELLDYIPEHAILPVEYKCNLACGMCPYHGRDKNLYLSNFTRQQKSLPTDIIKTRLDKLAALGVKNIQVGADGEFFLRNDWEEIWAYAASLSRVTMTTNGTVLDQKKLEGILQYKDKIDCIKISLNALTYDTWCLVCGAKNKNLYDTAMKAVEILADNYVNVVPSMVVTNENQHEVASFVEYWASRRISVNITNELSTEDLLHGDPEVDNSHWPYYSCAAINSALLVCIDGSIVPCCRTAYCPDDANSYDIPIINLDAPIETVKSQWLESLKNKAFLKVCRTCPMFSLRLDKDWGKSSHLYGYKGYLNADGFAIGLKRKKKKTTRERVFSEFNRFKQRLKNKFVKLKD